MTETIVRKCWFYRFGPAKWFAGEFHQWGTEAEGGGRDCSYAITVGIIEDEAGLIVTPLPYQVSFRGKIPDLPPSP